MAVELWCDVRQLHHALDLPPWLPDEHPPAPVPQGVAYLLDPDGKPYPGDSGQQYARHALDVTAQRRRFSRRTYHRGSRPLTVTTEYKGLNLMGSVGPPLLWETVIVADEEPVGLWQYSTPGAALAGHRRVIAAVERLQRRRRALADVRRHWQMLGRQLATYRRHWQMLGPTYRHPGGRR